MKKLLCSLLLLVAISANAQVYQKGSKFANIGVGLSPGIGVIGTYEIGFHEAISAGAFASYQSWGSSGLSNYGRVAVGGRADYHLGEILKKANVNLDLNKMDPYAGIQLGVGIFTGSYGTLARTRLLYGGHAGMRYMFKPSLGFFGEVGYDVSYLKAGVTLKLGK